jgi:hypothetical protein
VARLNVEDLDKVRKEVQLIREKKMLKAMHEAEEEGNAMFADYSARARARRNER